MDNALFNQLPERTQLAYLLGIASQFLGQDQVTRYYRQIAPLVADQMGHGDVPNPKENYWDGVWQVYQAD